MDGAHPSDTAMPANRVFTYLRNYFRGFAVLRETRMEYWGLQLVNFFDLAAYFALTNIITVWLSEKFAYSDIWAGYVWAITSATVSLTMFFTGALTDWLGIRRALAVSMVGNVVARAGLMVAGLVSEETLRPYTAAVGFDTVAAWVATVGHACHVIDPTVSHRAILAFICLIILAPFMGMSTTVYQAGNRRFTTALSRAAGFNLWYLVMNIGSSLGGDIVDVLHNPKFMGLDATHIMTFGAVCCAAGYVMNFLLIRNETQLYGPDEEPAVEVPKERTGYLASMGAVLQQPVFWRFLVVVSCIVCVRAIFIYLHAMYPKYWQRVIAPDAYIGFLQGYNPKLVVLGLILLIPLLKRFTVFGMLGWGALISTSSLFIMAIPAYGQAAYVTSLISLTVLTVGEVTWSPRLYEYTAAIAPRGQEGVYYGMAVLPWFIAKTIASALSGHLLNWFVPEYPKGEPILAERLARGEIPFWNSPSALFLILGTITVIGPIVAITLRGWFTKGAHWKTEAAS